MRRVKIVWFGVVILCLLSTVAFATARRLSEEEIRYQASPGVRGRAETQPAVVSPATEKIDPIIITSDSEEPGSFSQKQVNGTLKK